MLYLKSKSGTFQEEKMLTREKALYQLKLILDYLPQNEYQLISKETIEYIEKNMEIDESIQIDPAIDLDEQNIDDLTYEYLEEVIDEMQFHQKKEADLEQNIQKVQEDIKTQGYQIEIKELQEIIERLKQENTKIPKAKSLMMEYKEALAQSEAEREKLRKNLSDMYETFQKIPKIIKKIFIKDWEKKLLN